VPVDPDYLTNNSVSPKKSTLTGNQVQYTSLKGNSKFNLVNRAMANAGSFPAVVNSNRSGVLSPKASGGRGMIS